MCGKILVEPLSDNAVKRLKIIHLPFLQLPSDHHCLALKSAELSTHKIVHLNVWSNVYLDNIIVSKMHYYLHWNYDGAAFFADMVVIAMDGNHTGVNRRKWTDFTIRPKFPINYNHTKSQWPSQFLHSFTSPFLCYYSLHLQASIVAQCGNCGCRIHPSASETDKTANITATELLPHHAACTQIQGTMDLSH